jgi:large subunit ribosomal protein L10
MNRQEKQLIITTIKQDFSQSQATFLVGVQGLTVETVHILRKNLHAKGSQLKVAKNTLLRLALQDSAELSSLTPYFKDQIALIFAPTDAPAVAQIITQVAKENAKLVIIAGALSSKVIDKAQVEYLASLPSKEVMLARLCGTLNAPITGLVSVLHQLTLRLLWVLQQAQTQQKQQQQD